MDQWDHLQGIWDQDLMDQWDLQWMTWVRHNLIWTMQAHTMDRDLRDQMDLLQELTWMVMGCLLHLQGIWDQDLMDQWDQIHYLVIVDQQADHLQVIQEDLLQVIL